MKKITKAFRLMILICLILLACIGVGIAGGVPLPSINGRKDSEKEDIEMVEDNKAETDSITMKIKG